MEKNKKFKENHKTFKSANDISTIDVTPWLDADYKVKENGEEVYRGKIVFSITEKGKAYLKFFVNKDKAKLLFEAIRTGNFTTVFPNGFEDYGSSRDESGLLARSFSVKTGQNIKGQSQFIFKIEEGPGEYIVDRKSGKTNGAVKKTKTNKQATKYITVQEGMIMAIETLDYIRDREAIGLNNGKPLYTLTHFEPINQSQEAEPAPNEEEEVVEVGNQEPVHTLLEGKPVTELTNLELQAQVEKVKVATFPDLAFKEMIIAEARRRIAEKKAQKNVG